MFWFVERDRVNLFFYLLSILESSMKSIVIKNSILFKNSFLYEVFLWRIFKERININNERRSKNEKEIYFGLILFW